MDPLLIFGTLMVAVAATCFLAAVWADLRGRSDEVVETRLTLSGGCWWTLFFCSWVFYDVGVLRQAEISNILLSLSHAPTVYEQFLIYTGGWARLFAGFFFSSAAGAGVIAILTAWFIRSVPAYQFWGVVVAYSAIGAAFVVGLLPTLDLLQKVVAIAAGVIAGTLGLVKLNSMMRGDRSDRD